MIVFPRSVEEALAATGEYRAGGTDLQERRHKGIAEGPLVDLRDLPGLDTVVPQGTGWSIGAKVRVADVAGHPELRRYPALVASAGALATPAIRAVGTVGGNLLQRVRCWYYRNPTQNCLKKGGDMCLARAGDHLFHSCFDRGACLAPHPSTLALAFLVQEATVTTSRGSVSMAQLLGDGTDPRRENRLETGELLLSVQLPEPWPGEKGAYFRAISRARAEWPLVECAVRLSVVDGKIAAAAVAIGGVATIPLRLPKVEAALLGQLAGPGALNAALLATDGAKPPPMTAYKVKLLAPTVRDTLARALELP